MEEDSQLFDSAFCSAIEIRYENLVLGEVYYRLAKRIFGDGKEAMNTFTHIKRTIRDMKVGLGIGSAHKYETRFFQLNSYLPYCPWNSGWLAGRRPREYDEFEKREILDEVLAQPHKDKLKKMGWDVTEKDFSSTLTELGMLELQINKDHENYLNVQNVLKATGTNPLILTKKEKLGFSPGTKGDGKQEKEIKACGRCGKKNRGQCLQPKRQKTASQEGEKKYKGFNTSKKTYKFIKMSVIREERDKNKKNDDGDEQWMRDTTPAQRAYMIRELGVDEDSNVNLNSFSKKRLRELKGNAKEWYNDNGL